MHNPGKWIASAESSHWESFSHWQHNQQSSRLSTSLVLLAIKPAYLNQHSTRPLTLCASLSRLGQAVQHLLSLPVKLVPNQRWAWRCADEKEQWSDNQVRERNQWTSNFKLIHGLLKFMIVACPFAQFAWVHLHMFWTSKLWSETINMFNN